MPDASSGTMSVMVDAIGQELAPGDIIAYAHSAGRSAVLRFYKITRLDDHGFFAWGLHDRYATPRLTFKEVKLHFPDRGIRVPLSMLPELHQTLFNSAPVSSPTL